MLRAIIEYRSFILGLVKKDFKAKYMNSVLGALWAILNPLALILVYTVIFAEVMGSKIPGIDDTFAFSIYICAGLLTWQYFLETTQKMINVFIEYSNMLKKVSFPRITLPIAVVLTSTVNFVIIFSLFLIFLLITDKFPIQTILSSIPLLILIQLLAVGFGLIVGTLNMFFRDIGQFIGVFLQFLFWLTPIVYTVTIIPEWAQDIIQYNIVYPIISAMQNIYLNNISPHWEQLLWPFIVTIILLVIGYILFKKLENEMVDEL